MPARFPLFYRTPSPVGEGMYQEGCVSGMSGKGRDRAADLPLFRRTLIPTELPYQVNVHIIVDVYIIECRSNSGEMIIVWL